MSNLSELLPTGGGQNAVDFVASGTIGNGVTVALNSDGTVGAISQTSGFGTPVSYDVGARYQFDSDWDTVQNKVLIIYRDTGTSNYPVMVVGTVSGTSISFGSPVVYESNATNAVVCVWDESNSCFFVGTSVSASSNLACANVQISGTVPSLSSGKQYTAGNNFSDVAAAYYPPQQSIVAIHAGTSTYGQATSFSSSVASDPPSVGTPSIFEYNRTNQMAVIYDPPSQKLITAYRQANAQGICMALTPTNVTSGFTFGSTYAFGTDPLYIRLSYDSDQQRVIGVFQDSNLSSYGYAQALYISSGYTIVRGTATVFQSSTTYYPAIIYDLVAQKTAIFSVDTATGTLYALPTTLSNTTFTFGTAVNETSITYYLNSNAVPFASYSSNLGISVVGASASTPSAYTNYASVFELDASNNTSFIGITAEAISDTATGAVNVYGGINEAQTGLTIGSDYYVQNDGSLSTATTTVKVGKAISATTINMMDLT